MKKLLPLPWIIIAVFLLRTSDVYAQCNTTPCTFPVPEPNAMDACILPSPQSLDCYFGETFQSTPLSFPPSWCTSIENNHFFGFTADSSVASFRIENLGCSQGNGIQAAVLATIDCVNFAFVSQCLGNITVGNTDFLFASNLIKGQNYYLMIDGNAGALCYYSINAPNINISGPTDGLCIPSSNTATYATMDSSHWEIFPASAGNIISPNPAPFVEVEWLETGLAQICAQNVHCPGATGLCLDVIVGNDVSTQVEVDLVEGSTVQCAGQTFSQPGTFMVHFPTYLNCDSTVNCIVHLVPKLPPWEVYPTGNNHTIILPTDLMSDSTMPLLGGDYVGMFYDSLGTQKCAGFGRWDNMNTAFSVYGSDAPLDNGFNVGEEFVVKVWRAALDLELDATAQYAPIGTLGIISHTDTYAVDGLSMITHLSIAALHPITLYSGWNMISSYVQPSEPDMLTLFEPISNSVDLIKDGDGNITIPAPPLSINQIGDWNLLKGYQVRANQQDTLLVIGQRVMPEANPIPLQTGWQIIAYLRANPQSIDTVFNSIKNQINLVKDNAGKVYVPQFNINTIGDMQPGQGYKVNALSNTTLAYKNNFAGPIDERGVEKDNLESSHFAMINQVNTGNNATIVLPADIAENLFQHGDEIAVFSLTGILSGTAKYHEGENLAITVWGDDPTTTNVIEGLQPGDLYNFKIWNSKDQQEYSAISSFSSGINSYAPDAIDIISGMYLLSVGLETLETVGVQLLQLFPNPASEFLTVEIMSKESGKVSLSVLGLNGQRVLDSGAIEYQVGQTISPIQLPAKLPTGMYHFKFQFEKGVIYRQILIKG